MGLEIERKFLVDDSAFRKIVRSTYLRPTHIQQGYLSLSPAVRVRVKDRKSAFITIKGPGLLERKEFEYPLPYTDACEMLDLCKQTMTKLRYRVDGWDVDEFLGPLQGLWLAEFELKASKQPFELPTWTGREVTEDRRYQNTWLIENGIPTSI